MKLIPLYITLSICITASCQNKDIPLETVMNLPKAVEESSGIAKVGNEIFTFNDSGDGANIYWIDLGNKKMGGKIKLKGANNKDWEDISYLNGDLYISDTGGNTTSKKKKTIYKVNAESLLSFEKKTEEFESWDFNFYNKEKKLNVNCEAMVAEESGVYLFSKENGQTDIYHLNLSIDSTRAIPIATKKIKGQITGIAKVEEGHYVAVSYHKVGDDIYISDIIVVTIPEGKSWRESTWTPMKLNLGGQCEGIDYSEGYIYLSSERNNLNKGKLYRMPYPKI